MGCVAKLNDKLKFDFLSKGEPVPVSGQARLLIMGSVTYAFSRARVLVVRSQTSVGPKYWMAPG